MRKQNGITLISLVITIIVLLILAGVSIAMLTGENGILTQATKAANETKYAEAREAVLMFVNEKGTEYQALKYDTDTTNDPSGTMEQYIGSALTSTGIDGVTGVVDSSDSKLVNVTIVVDGANYTSAYSTETGKFADWPQI